MIVFGPVPSRRLGRSLGINNIPRKYCTYSCIYCQLGGTDHMVGERRPFFDVHKLYSAVSDKLETIYKQDDSVDYLTFVASGEPTLDIHLGQAIQKLKAFGIPIAVISNGSLTSDPSVRQDLMNADWVSLSVDAVDEKIWRSIDRPFGRLNLSDILEGTRLFSAEYSGFFATETMLINDLNTCEPFIGNIASFIGEIKPDVAYLSLPIRPPAEAYVKIPDASIVNIGYQTFKEKIPNVELIGCHEIGDFSAGDDVDASIVDILSVHPMRRDSLTELLNRYGRSASDIRRLIDSGLITSCDYQCTEFFMKAI